MTDPDDLRSRRPSRQGRDRIPPHVKIAASQELVAPALLRLPKGLDLPGSPRALQPQLRAHLRHFQIHRTACFIFKWPPRAQMRTDPISTDLLTFRRAAGRRKRTRSGRSLIRPSTARGFSTHGPTVGNLPIAALARSCPWFSILLEPSR